MSSYFSPKTYLPQFRKSLVTVALWIQLFIFSWAQYFLTIFCNQSTRLFFVILLQHDTDSGYNSAGLRKPVPLIKKKLLAQIFTLLTHANRLLSLEIRLTIRFLKKMFIVTRDGVENTRLEAKAKDTKKSVAKNSPTEDRPSRGQGPRIQLESDLQKMENKKVFAPKLLKFPKILRVLHEKISSENFLQTLWRSSRRNKLGHDLGPFSPSQKIVLFSSRGQGFVEDLQASRPRTSKCVLKDTISHCYL